MLAFCRISVASSGAFFAVFWVCYSKDVPVNRGVFLQMSSQQSLFSSITRTKEGPGNRPKMDNFVQKRKSDNRKG